MQAQLPRNSAQAATARVTTDAGIDYPITVTFFLQSVLQHGNPGLVEIHAVPGAETVADNEQSRPVGRGTVRRNIGRRCGDE